MNLENSKQELFTIVMEAEESDPEEYRPIFKKISKSTYCIYYWKSKVNANRFIKEQNFPEEECKVVNHHDRVVLKTLKDYEDQFVVEKKIAD